MVQHLVGLADAGRGAEEDLQPAARALLAARRVEQRVGRGARSASRPVIGIGVLSCRSRDVAASRVQREVERQHVDARLAEEAERAALDLARRRGRAAGPRGRPRALATRGTWNRAASGEMCGSRPEPLVVTRSTGTGAAGFSAFSAVEVAPSRARPAPRWSGRGWSPTSWRRCRAPAPSSWHRPGRRPWWPRAGRGSSASLVKAWPIRPEPTTVPSRSIRLPAAWRGKSAPAMPVMASG